MVISLHVALSSSKPLACSLLGLTCKQLTRSIQAEAKQSNGSVFRRNLLNRLQQEFKAREETRKRSTQEWVCLVSFICNIFDYLKVNSCLWF